jgi:hypothetical protein
MFAHRPCNGAKRWKWTKPRMILNDFYFYWYARVGGLGWSGATESVSPATVVFTLCIIDCCVSHLVLWDCCAYLWKNIRIINGLFPWKNFNRNRNSAMGQVDTKPNEAAWPQLSKLDCFWEIVQHMYIKIALFSKSLLKIEKGRQTELRPTGSSLLKQ